MDQSDARAHVRDVLGVMERMRPDLELPADGPEWLLRSWRRSIEAHRLDPCAKARRRVYTASEVRETWDRMDLFREVARPHVEDLFRQVSVADYCVIVTDASGLTIDLKSTGSMQTILRRAGAVVGTVWSESEEGTCGVGTAIMDRRPVLVHKADHFRVDNLPLSCSAAPILGPDDEVVAVLDASTLHSPYSRDSQSLVFEMVTERARLIEDAYLSRLLRAHWRLWLGPRAEHAGTPGGELMLAFDDAGRVIGANRLARERLLARFPRGAPVRLDDLLDCPADSLVADACSTPGLPLPVRLRHRGETMHALLRAPERPAARIASPPRPATKDTAPRRDDALDALALGDGCMRAHVARARRLADKPLPIMLLGETGTGKEVFARAIHAVSGRRARPFVAVNCAAIPESLIESELFGYREGAFTGARSSGAPGRIQQASGGTLFLDEIGDMPLPLQSRLLRVLAEGEVTPLGGTESVPVDLHVICATHQDLAALVRTGGFREDLYYRLDGAVFELPPLREREDIDAIIQRLLVEEAAVCGAGSVRVAPDAMAAMLRHPWPGNIRQLRHALRHACALCEDGFVDLDCLPREVREGAAPGAARPHRPGVEPSSTTKVDTMRVDTARVPPVGPADEAMRARMLDALARRGWRVTAAARDLGVPRSTFYRRMEALGIDGPQRLLETRC